MTIDIRVVEEARLGDQEAFTRLYEQVYADLYKTALFILGSRSDAEDAVSETFLDAYRGIRKLKEPSAFKSWIFKILQARCNRKIALNYKLRNHFNLEDFALSDTSLCYNQNSDDKLVLMNALYCLNYHERSIVFLSVIQGYKIREIAEILKMPQGTVSSKLHRCLEKLKKTIERGEYCEVQK